MSASGSVTDNQLSLESLSLCGGPIWPCGDAFWALKLLENSSDSSFRDLEEESENRYRRVFAAVVRWAAKAASASRMRRSCLACTRTMAMTAWWLRRRRSAPLYWPIPSTASVLVSGGSEAGGPWSWLTPRGLGPGTDWLWPGVCEDSPSGTAGPYLWPRRIGFTCGIRRSFSVHLVPLQSWAPGFESWGWCCPLARLCSCLLGGLECVPGWDLPVSTVSGFLPLETEGSRPRLSGLDRFLGEDNGGGGGEDVKRRDWVVLETPGVVEKPTLPFLLRSFCEGNTPGVHSAPGKCCPRRLLSLFFCFSSRSVLVKVGVRSRMALRSLRTLSCSQRDRFRHTSLACCKCSSCCRSRRSSRAFTSRALMRSRASNVPPDNPEKWLSWYRWLTSGFMAAQFPTFVTQKVTGKVEWSWMPERLPGLNKTHSWNRIIQKINSQSCFFVLFFYPLSLSPGDASWQSWTGKSWACDWNNPNSRKWTRNSLQSFHFWTLKQSWTGAECAAWSFSKYTDQISSENQHAP